jgi:hypothetical protein
MHSPLLRRLAVTAATAAVVAVTVPAAQAATAAPGGSQPTTRPHSTYTLPAGYADPCPAPAAGTAGCADLAGPVSGATVQEATATWPGYGPADLQAAYNLPSTMGGSLVTVAVVTPYHDPDAASDLAAYRSNYGLTPCSVADGCFTQVNQAGTTTPPPPENALFTTATSLSLDMISATCPNCHLLLVEADSTAISDLGIAEDEAVTLGTNVIDNPWTIAEASLGSTETSYDHYFDHPGVAITAPAGDNGYGVNYPAASQYVTAVGGTALQPASSTPSGWSEYGWNDTGSGCSAYEPKPSWQADGGCANRMLNDVAALADPQYPVAYYDTPFAGGNSTIGGTDVAAAIVAGVYGLAGVPAAGTYPASYPYLHPGGSYTTPGTPYPYLDGLNNIDAGSPNASPCTVSYWCTPGLGYNGPTGLGSPATALAFSGSGGDSGTVYNGLGNFCLDNTGGSTTNGNPVQIFTCNGNSTQNWTFEPNGTIQFSSGHCLGVSNAETTAGTAVVLAASCATSNPGVIWLPHANNTLYNPNSGMCLYAPAGTSGTKLQIHGCAASRTESFLLPFSDPTASGLVVSDLSSSVCLYDLNGSTTGGNAIQVIGCNPASRSDNFTLGTDGSLQVEGGCILPAGSGTSNGTAIAYGGCNGSQAEHWIIRSDGSLRNLPTNNSCLDDANASTANNNPVDLSSCSGSANQLWKLP